MLLKKVAEHSEQDLTTPAGDHLSLILCHHICAGAGVNMFSSRPCDLARQGRQVHRDPVGHEVPLVVALHAGIGIQPPRRKPATSSVS